ncbi:hypothetical protein MASR2M17_01020 [Aminivibrio sp.]
MDIPRSWGREKERQGETPVSGGGEKFHALRAEASALPLESVRDDKGSLSGTFPAPSGRDRPESRDSQEIFPRSSPDP